MVDKKSLEEAALAMLDEAKAMGVLGTALVGMRYIREDGELVVNISCVSSRLIREPDPTRGSDDKGTNYGGFAAGKLFQSLRWEIVSVFKNRRRFIPQA